MSKFFIETIKDIHHAFCAFVGDKDSNHESCIEPMKCQKADTTRTTNDKIHIDRSDARMLCNESLVVLVGAIHVASCFDLVLILLGERLARAYHAGSFEVSAFGRENAVIHIALDGAFVACELWGVCDADVMNRLARLDFGRDELVNVLTLPVLQCRALAMFAKDFPVVFMSPHGNIEELALVAVFLVRASVADLGRAFRALGAIDVLHFFAVFVAVAITASAARDTVARAVLADARKFTVGTMDALVGSSVASFETFAGVLSDFPRDSR